MAGTTGNRGYVYPTLADANDVPFYMQSLAEAVDLDVQALDSATFKRKGLTLASNYSLTSDSVTEVPIPGLATSFQSTGGHLYRITLNVVSRSTNLSDIVQFKIKVDGTDIGEFPKGANSGRDNVGTSNYHVLTAYYTAPGSALRNATVVFQRAAGTGTITVQSSALMRHSLLVEDLGTV